MDKKLDIIQYSKHGGFKMSDTTVLKKSIPQLYFVALFAQMMGNSMAQVYTIFYMTERMLIPTLITGAVLFAARLVDLVSSVVVGAIIQKVSLKHGQYRSWLYYGPFMVSIGTALHFINFPVPVMAKATQIFIAYFLYGTGMSFIQLSQNGLLAKIAGPDMRHRIILSGKINQGNQAGRIVSSAIIMPLILLIDKLGTDGYTVVQIMMSLCALIGQLPLFFMTKEYEQFDPEFKRRSSGGVKLTTMFATVLKNGQLLLLMLADGIRFTVIWGMTGLGVYYFRYVAQNMGLFTLALTVQSVCAFIASLAMPAVARKTGKKNAGIISGVSMTLFLAALAWQGMTSPMVYIVCIAGFSISSGLILSCGVNLYLDCGEYQLYKSGADARTFTMGMYGVSAKVGFLLSTLLSTIVLEGSGYSGVTNTVENLGRMALLLGGIPAGLTLAYTLVMLLYGITEKKAKEYAEHNHTAALAAKTATTG
jgi:Na+/melibiose symporter-like transporter